MVAKDRLTELKNFNGGKIYDDTVVENGFAGKDASEDVQSVFSEVQRIRDWIEEINANTRRMKILYSNPTFQTNKSLQEELDSKATISNANGLKICGALKQFEDRVAHSGNDVIGRIVRLQYATTRQLYCEALGQHDKFLQTFRDYQYALLQEQIRLTNLTISDEECEKLLDNNNVALFVDNVSKYIKGLQAETNEARLALRDVEQRHQELLKIEGSIQEVRDLFVQMSHLVMQQQDLVDRVEYYATQASDNIELGGKQLLQGTINKRKARKKKIGIIICLSTGALIVLLILIYT